MHLAYVFVHVQHWIVCSVGIILAKFGLNFASKSWGQTFGSLGGIYLWGYWLGQSKKKAQKIFALWGKAARQISSERKVWKFKGNFVLNSSPRETLLQKCEAASFFACCHKIRLKHRSTKVLLHEPVWLSGLSNDDGIRQPLEASSNSFCRVIPEYFFCGGEGRESTYLEEKNTKTSK